MVLIPFISKPNRKLYKRKGGGGRGGGGGRSGGGSSSSGASSGGRSSGSINTGGRSKSVTSFGRGGGPVTTIPAGQPFAGRTQGGGTRDQIYGSRQYGSGYPGVSNRGVADRGFPFYFWPLAWGGAAGGTAGAYLYTREYGSASNTSRPGGPLSTAAFSSSTSNNTTYRLLADNSTVVSLITDIVSSCGNSITSPSDIAPSAYNDTGPPLPEQTVQYYRASTVALTLDGYNNTAVFSTNESVPDVPLPSNNIDVTLLNCLNTTIGQAVPLVDAAIGVHVASPSTLGLLCLVGLITRLIQL